MSFKKNKYCVIKEAIPKQMAEFVYNYFLMKRQVARTLFDTRYISPFTTEFGVWNDEQVPNTYSHYADIAMETLLLRCLPIMEKTTKLKLNPTYSKFYNEYKKRKSAFLGGFWVAPGAAWSDLCGSWHVFGRLLVYSSRVALSAILGLLARSWVSVGAIWGIWGPALNFDSKIDSKIEQFRGAQEYRCR